MVHGVCIVLVLVHMVHGVCIVLVLVHMVHGVCIVLVLVHMVHAIRAAFTCLATVCLAFLFTIHNTSVLSPCSQDDRKL